MARKTIFKKQMVLYMSILFISLFVFGTGAYTIYTNQYMKEQEKQLILQGERFKESMIALYLSGAVDMSRLDFELQIMEKYMDVSVFFMNDRGKVSLVSQSLNKSWIGQTITDEAVDIVLSGKVATLTGRIGGMFNETVLTVGYPISVGGINLGGVFMCKPINVMEKAANDMRNVLLLSMLPVAFIVSCLVFFFSKRISQPLMDMNEAAKIIADGSFDKRITVKSSDEVGQLAQSLNNMAETLEKNENNRRKFIANVSHDLRSPLTSIQGFIGAIVDGTIPYEKQGYYLNIVLEETSRLTKLANDMVDLSKTEAGVMAVEFCEFDINDMVRESLQTFEQRFIQKKISANAVFDREHLNVKADANMILRVIHNLLDNAIKFSCDGGEITIETWVGKQKVYVCVKDSGKGIKEEEQRRVFERFFKSDASRGLDKSGVGLGLSIVKEFIRAHGEKIEIKSEVDKGTEFIFSLKKGE